MGTQLSGLAQLVASLEGRTDAETDLTELADLTEVVDLTDLVDEELADASPLVPAPPGPAPAALAALDEVARAVVSARQRLDALAHQVAELRRRTGGDPAERTRPVG